MITLLKVLTFLTTNWGVFLDILNIIMEAAKLFTNGDEKQEYALRAIKIKRPKLTEDEIYDWVKVVLYIVRLIGVKI